MDGLQALVPHAVPGVLSALPSRVKQTLNAPWTLARLGARVHGFGGCAQRNLGSFGGENGEIRRFRSGLVSASSSRQDWSARQRAHGPTKGCGRTVSTTPGRTVPSLMQNSKRRSHGVSHQRTPRRGRSWTWIAQFRPGRFTIHSRVHVSKQDAVALASKAAKQTPWTGEDGRELETRTTCLLPSCEAGSFVDLPAGARPKEHSQTECKRRRFDRQKRLARAELVSLSVPCRFVSQIGGPCSGFNPTIPTPAQSELQPWITSQEVSEGTTSTSSHVSVLCRLYAALCAHVPALNSHMPPVCRSLRACPSLGCPYGFPYGFPHVFPWS